MLTDKKSPILQLSVGDRDFMHWCWIHEGRCTKVETYLTKYLHNIPISTEIMEDLKTILGSKNIKLF